MNKKSGLVLRIILGAYLIFLGCNLLMQLTKIQPSDMAVKSVFAVIFIVTGALYAFINIRAVYRMVKEETTDPEEKTEEEQQLEKPQRDKSIFRTAPMPSEEVLRKANVSQETDLRANMKYMEEAQEEKNEETQTEVKPESKATEKAAEQKIPAEQTAEKEAAGKVEETAEKAEETTEKAEETTEKAEETTEKAEETAEADSVHLAIEIMRSEEEALEMADEELEKDYEEK